MRKIKEVIKTFFKENYKPLIILIVLYLFLNIPVNVSIYTPGGIIDLSDRIISKDKIYDSKGSINMSYVRMVKGTIPTYLLAKIIPTWDIIENEKITYNENNDIEETINIDKYYLEESISNAYMLAFNKASIDYEVTESKNYVTYIHELAKTDLKLFDNIKKYDNIEFSTFNNMQRYIANKKVGEKVDFLVLRNKKEIKCSAELIDIEGNTKIGISTALINEYKSIPNIELTSKNSESGSSGGFMMALAIYDAITKDDLTHGLKIAGTGTIDAEGNVGVIGGVIYKLSGAVKKDVDIFLVPDENYDEALKYKKDHNFDIELVSISTFDEAVEYLNNKEE